MEILRKSDNMVFTVYGAVREVQRMPATGWSEVVTWFLIWEKNPVNGTDDWSWVLGKDFVPYQHMNTNIFPR